MAVFEATKQNAQQVKKRTDAKQTECEEIQHTSSDLAYIESMYANYTKEQAQEERNPLALLGISNAGVSNRVGIDIGVGIDNIDDRLLNRLSALQRRLTTIGAESSGVRNFLSAILTKHNDTSFLIVSVKVTV